jgi:acyl carrier protein phosphodiesterase
MNYLAHAYLSFNRPGILVGNMISDFIKGKKKYGYAADILFGIDLHRAIDDFTDMHPVTKSAKQVFQPVYGLYSGAFMDITYDYFIANDKQLFEPGSLETFSKAVYDTLGLYTSIFPPRFNQLFPSMKKYNWLLNYRNDSGIQRSFEGLTYRATYMSDSTAAFNLFLLNKEMLADAYSLFFPELIRFTKDIIESKGL